MKQTLFQEKYPVYTLELSKGETALSNVDAIIDYLKGKVEAHPAATFIATFDHYSHTKSLENGEIAQAGRELSSRVFPKVLR